MHPATGGHRSQRQLHTKSPRPAAARRSATSPQNRVGDWPDCGAANYVRTQQPIPATARRSMGPPTIFVAAMRFVGHTALERETKASTKS